MHIHIYEILHTGFSFQIADLITATSDIQNVLVL
jgi:hypothetical protein